MSFLCIALVLVLGIVAVVASHRFRWKTIDYITQRAQNPTLKPPKTVKLGNTIIRYLTLILVIGLGSFMLYALISTRAIHRCKYYRSTFYISNCGDNFGWLILEG